MPRTGVVWNYYRVVDEGAKKAECNYCKKMLSFKTTITNLKNHLKHKHIIVFEAINQDRNDATRSIAVTTASSTASICDGAVASTSGNNNFNIAHNSSTNNNLNMSINNNPGAVLPLVRPCPSSSDTTVNSRIPAKQQRMNVFLRKNLTTQEKDRLDKLLLRMIALDCQPFSIVDDEGFKELVAALNPNYSLPSRKTLSTTLLFREYGLKLTHVKELVNNYCLSMSISVDCWTSKTLQPYIAITGHFIHSESLAFKSILLECIPLDGSHTGQNIAAVIKRVIQEWDLNTKIIFIVTDNASNMQSAANLLPWPHFGCYAHKLNLIAQNALAVPEVARAIAKVQKTVAHFKRSSHSKEKLLKYQINSQGVVDGNALGLITSVPTRWNSTFLMLERFLRLQEAIRATVPNLNVDLPIMTLEEWRCLEQYCTALKPLYEATLIMSAENYLTASKAILITQGLLTIYQKIADNTHYFEPVLLLIRTICTGLSNRFSGLEQNIHIAVCSLLDPRFKTFAFQNQNSLITTKTFVIDKLCQATNPDVEETMQSTPVECGNVTVSEEESSLSLWAAFDKKVSNSQRPRTVSVKVKEEMEMFLKQPVIEREECPLEWWRRHKLIYPYLFNFFIKNCNVIVTSVPCERTFSKAGHIISDRRTRLITNKVTKLMFLHCNKNV